MDISELSSLFLTTFISNHVLARWVGWSQLYQIWFEFPAYVDTNLVGTGKISKAAILGLEGGVWAHSADFTVHCNLCIAAIPLTLLKSHQLSTDEQKAIVKGFTKPDDLQAGGIRLAGQKYVTISADAKIIQGKKGVCSFPWNFFPCF